MEFELMIPFGVVIIIFATIICRKYIFIKKSDEDIITYSRRLVGKTNPVQADPDSIRGHFSQDSYVKADQEHRLVNNIIHASDSHESANRELHIWEKFLNL